MHQRLIIATFCLSLVAVALGVVALLRITDSQDESQPQITVAITIVDKVTGAPVVGDLFVNDQLLANDVTEYSFTFPADEGWRELRVEAPGCLPRKLGIRAHFERNRRLRGPMDMDCGSLKESF